MRTIALFFSLAFASCSRATPPSPLDSPATSIDSSAAVTPPVCVCPEHSLCEDAGCAVDPAWKIVDIALGYSFGCARYPDGAVRCAGTNEYGQLGNGGASKPPDLWQSPSEVKEARGATQIAVGASHACALMKGGQSVCWGLGQKGEIGSGFTGTFTHPDPVRGLDHAVMLMASSTITCGIDDAGAASCWGANDVGQLGDGTHDDNAHPSTVKGVTKAKSIASDGARVCALLADGRVTCWGRKSTGKSGPAEIVPALAHVDEIAMSSNVLFARIGGSVWTVSTVLEGAPTRKPDIDDATALAVGRDHACVLRASGEVACFGANAKGQLGDGTTTTRPDARPPKENVPAKLVAASADITCVVHKDDTLACFGDERQGLAKIALLGAAPVNSPAHVVPPPSRLPPYVPTPGTSVVVVTLSDSLKLKSGTVTPPQRSTLFYRVPTTWLEGDSIRAEKKDAMLAKLYGVNWKKGNADGSEYVVQSFASRVLTRDDESTRPWLTAPTPRWFYDVAPGGELVKITQDKF